MRGKKLIITEKKSDHFKDARKAGKLSKVFLDWQDPRTAIQHPVDDPCV